MPQIPLFRLAVRADAARMDVVFDWATRRIEWRGRVPHISSPHMNETIHANASYPSIPAACAGRRPPRLPRLEGAGAPANSAPALGQGAPASMAPCTPLETRDPNAPEAEPGLRRARRASARWRRTSPSRVSVLARALESPVGGARCPAAYCLSRSGRAGCASSPRRVRVGAPIAWGAGGGRARAGRPARRGAEPRLRQRPHIFERSPSRGRAATRPRRARRALGHARQPGGRAVFSVRCRPDRGAPHFGLRLAFGPDDAHITSASAPTR